MKKEIINKIKQIFSRMWVIILMAIFSNKALARFFQTEYGVQVKYGVQPMYGDMPIITPSVAPIITPPLDQPLYGVPQPLYGVIPQPTDIVTPTPTPTPPITDQPFLPTYPPMQTFYGSPITPITEYWTAERVLATIILPLVVLIVLFVGVVVYIKRKNKK